MNAPHNLIVAALEVVTGIHIDGLAFPHIVFTGSGARAVAVRDLVTCTQYRHCTNANGRQMRQTHSIMLPDSSFHWQVGGATVVQKFCTQVVICKAFGS